MSTLIAGVLGVAAGYLLGSLIRRAVTDMALEQIIELQRDNKRLRAANLEHAAARVLLEPVDEDEERRALAEWLAEYDPTIDTGRNPHDWSTE